MNQEGTYFQSAYLVGSPSYPNSVAWSDENLVAIASGHLVTILNPAHLNGPRGLITIPASKPFPIGVISRDLITSSCLLPTCLLRDPRPCVRSLSWSRLGLATNAGCLLAVCTTEGRVKLYRSPYCEFSAEWIEVRDISDLLFDYLKSINYGEDEERAAEHETATGCWNDLQNSRVSKRGKRKIAQLSLDCRKEDENGGHTHTICTELASFPCPSFKKGASVEVLVRNGDRRIWVGGAIKRVVKAKALVLFREKMEDGKQDEWVELHGEQDSALISNGDTPSKNTPSLRMRPCMDVGYLPEEIALVEESDEVEEILSIGKNVEAWTNERWVEGLFMGFNGNNLTVKLSGDANCVELNAMSVRLAPVWNSEVKSWQVTNVKVESSNRNLLEIVEVQPQKVTEKPPKSTRGSGTRPLISAEKYASRSSMLSSVIVAWSPTLHLASGVYPNSEIRPSIDCAILAVGGKAGKISFWRIHEPRCYSVEQSKDSVDAVLVGLIQAHNTWITAICWEALKNQVLLVTGSSDGSVRIWLGDTEAMLTSSEVNSASFSLLKEVTTAAPSPVSILSLTASSRSPDKMPLAVGRGSGLLELWMCDTAKCEFQFAGSYDAHGQVVTGLAWSFDGRCLYSCGQDNTIHCWILHGCTLHKAPIPTNTLGPWPSTNLPHVSDSCFGLAVSPGNLVFVVARGFDTDLLNPMYQARTQKATVEFFWAGGQHLEVSSDVDEGCNTEPYPGLSQRELMFWESNILLSLNQYKNLEKPFIDQKRIPDKPLVLWDVITALSALEESTPKFAENILGKWLSSLFLDSNSGFPIDEILLHARNSLPKIHSLQIHLLNIIGRQLMLPELKVDTLNKQDGLEELGTAENENHMLWLHLLTSSERQLRERLVTFSFTTVLSLASSSSTNNSEFGYWVPHGVAQMEQWVAINQGQICLSSEASKLDKSKLHSISEYVTTERCNFCPAPVPFESPEVDSCGGSKNSNGVHDRHKLPRCAASMQVCPTTPLWLCVCCHRWVWKLPPHTLFTMHEFPLGMNSLEEAQVSPTPFCPFCGILLQRLQPEFLLSPSPV
ncbi:hypothetical protein MKW94_025537 [Papaver nudicaule]|uniref:Transcription factor IIIC 90kDa subunit N-terminal domain-containing protein n=1 Tax=Papaver nudicaule TaxID=74823 RepID=A0AA41SAU3_PAPNU|nr:hypothetical protein [Papaver nudicaule]